MLLVAYINILISVSQITLSLGYFEVRGCSACEIIQIHNRSCTLNALAFQCMLFLKHLK